MPLLPTLGRTVGSGIKAARLLVRGSVRSGAWATRRVGSARARGAANEVGMIRLFDLHALSCAGDTLITIGLAGTIFFNVPLGEARSKVALYLLVTMVPFALLAPVVGPLLDHFRHGRRWALAASMLGRAFLAFVISDHLLGWGLYPAAFGVLALSRAYGVARSAAVPRLLPAGIGLSQVGARASVYGGFAGALVAPVGLLAFKFGPQWPLRVATIIFLVGMVVSLRLPPRADSDPPEAVPRPFRTMLHLGRGEDRPLSGKLVIATLLGSASLRLLYGFLLLFLAFVIMGNQLDTTLFGREIGRQGAVGLIGGALAVGTFLSTAVGTKLRIHRPLALQSAGLTITAGVAVLSAIFFHLGMLALLALLTAIFSGISKLTVDASIQERVPERLRASAFAHSETVLMVAWVAGGAIGIIPLTGRLGVALAAMLAVLAAARAAWAAARLHNERLSGRADDSTAGDPHADPQAPGSRTTGPQTAGSHPAGRHTASPQAAGRQATGPQATGPQTPGRHGAEPTDPWPEAPTVPTRNRPNPPPQRGHGTATQARPAPSTQAGSTQAGSTAGSTRAGSTAGPTRAGSTAAGPQQSGRSSLDPTRIDPAAQHNTAGQGAGGPAPAGGPAGPAPAETGRKWWFGKRRAATPGAAPENTPQPAARQPAEPGPAQPDAALAPPGYHVYRPSSANEPASNGHDASPEDDDRR